MATEPQEKVERKPFFEIGIVIDPNREFVITGEQIMSLVGIAQRYKAATVRAGVGTFGLSTSYLGFTLLDDKGEWIISGGVDQEGRIST
jgi:hypothetical protein